MAGITTDSIATALQAAIAETRLYVNTNGVLLPTIDVSNVPVESYKIPTLTGGTVYTPNQNADITASDMSTDGPTITAIAHAIRVYISPLAEMSSPENFGIKVGQAFGLKMVEEMNQNIFAVGDTFTRSIGASDEPITLDLIKSAKNLLEATNAPGPYTLALTPYVMEDLIDAIFDSTSGTSAYSALRNEYESTGTIRSIYGINIVKVSDLASGTSAGQKDAASIKCSIYSKQAIAMNIARSFQIDSKVDISKAGSQEVVGSVYYGVGKAQDNYGVELLVQNKDA